MDHHQFYQQGSAAIPPAANFQVPYNLPWNVDIHNHTSGDHINEGGGGGGGEGRM